MKIYECIIPQIDVNDKRVVVNEFRYQNGDFVEKLETILSLETAKAVSDFYTEATGYIVYIVEEGDELVIGDTVAIIFDNEHEAVIYADKLKEQREDQMPSYKATAKAEKLAFDLGVDLSVIPKEGIIKEKDVQEYYDSHGGKNEFNIRY